MFTRNIAHYFLSALNHIQFGAISITTPEGQTYYFRASQPGSECQVTIYDWSAIRMMVYRGDVAMAEAYRDGMWDSSDPTKLFMFAMENQSALGMYIRGNIFGRLASRIAYFFTRNTVKGSRKNIHAHYDLGNEFYSLWLDPSMTYSSAIFKNSDDSLQDAQAHKYDRIIDRLNPSGSLLEIGCGWGGFAERALQRGDYGIKGLTISKAQHSFASSRIGRNGIIALEDYRHQKGVYDQIVSIEMFEAVGEKFWPIYFSKIKSLLADKGKAIVQTITIAEDSFKRYRRGGDAIRTFIFPGGMLPSPSRFREESINAGFRITDEFSFGINYAITLERWLENFDAKIKEIKAMGFDQKFIRIWRFYLMYCIAAFRHGRTNVMQWELQHTT